jgi:hypothetical protein
LSNQDINQKGTDIMQVLIDINKMSTASREAYLVDLIQDLADALARDQEKDLDGYIFNSDLLSYAAAAVSQYKNK